MRVSKSTLTQNTRKLGLAGLTGALVLLCGATIPETASFPSGKCPADATDRSICGISKPEDMAPLANSEWIIVSGYAPDSLYRVSSRTRRALNLIPSVRTRWNRKKYAECPGPLAPGGLTAHGIAVTNAHPHSALFVINHGGREAIEVYRLRSQDASLTWIGCIPIPDDMMANSVAQLKSGTLVVTSLGKPKSNVLADIIAGRPTGDVRLWSQDQGWRTLPHSEGSGPNGLALAPDDRSIYVAMSGSREIVRMSLDGKTQPIRSSQIDILPDNLRWTEEGTLITTGMRYDPEVNSRCFQGQSCQPQFDVYEINPKNLAVHSLSRRFDSKPMPLTTTALRVGDELWVSSISGENIAVFPLKRE